MSIFDSLGQFYAQHRKRKPKTLEELVEWVAQTQAVTEQIIFAQAQAMQDLGLRVRGAVQDFESEHDSKLVIWLIDKWFDEWIGDNSKLARLHAKLKDEAAGFGEVQDTQI